MLKSLRGAWWAAAIVLVVLMLGVACSREQPTEQAAQPAAQPAQPGAAQPAATQPAAGQPAATRPAAKPAGGPASPAASPAPKPAVALTIPAGTTIPVRLQQTISSDNASSGQAFEAVLAEPLVVDGRTVAAKGANAWGEVVKAVESGRLQTPAELYLKLTALEVNGQRVAISTSSVGRKGESHKKRNVGMIGGGAGLGAAIGAIAGGGKGAAIGAAAGAGAGTAGAAATGKKDITYPVETRLAFKLAQPVTIR